MRMKIASFNINNIRKHLPNLLNWLREAGPDVVCLQELKATDAEFPAEALQQAGYEPIWQGQKSRNGVAILARWAPVLTCGALPGDPSDTQSRYIAIHAWCAINNRKIARASWEIYGDWNSDPAMLETTIKYLLA